MAKITKLNLKQVEPIEVDKPMRLLGEAGRALWHRINGEFILDDSASQELLLLACEATDRAASCREAIERDGIITPSQSGTPRAHPLVQHENAAQKFASSTLQALGLAVEPTKVVGRPPSGGLGIRG